MAVGSVAAGAFGGSVSYRVTENPDACREVHLGRLTTPRDPENPREQVHGGACRTEIRSAGETHLYLTAACDWIKQFTQRWVPSPDKYAVDLNGPARVRRIDERTWQSGTPLSWSGNGGMFPRSQAAPGIEWKGHVLERSGPRWSGVGEDPIGLKLSQDGAKAAVNSWDGFAMHVDPLANFGSLSGGGYKVEGEYWVNVYDAISGRRLIHFEGTFKNTAPSEFLWHATWYGTRYYVIPLGNTSYLGSGLHRLLICDADAAAIRTTQR